MKNIFKSFMARFWTSNGKMHAKAGVYFWNGSDRNYRLIPLPMGWIGDPELIEFPEQTVVIAKDQPEYRPLPAHQRKDVEGTIVCCWQLSLRDRVKILLTGKIWHTILTFHQPLQPQLIQIDKPEMKNER